VSGAGQPDWASLDPSTLAVHLGRTGSVPGAPINPAVELSSTYRRGGDSVYGRDDNATWSAFEAALGGLEGGRALVFGSGMAATAAVVETVPVGGWVVVGNGSYTGTRLLLRDGAQRGRLSFRVADTTDAGATLAVCAEVAASPSRHVAGGLLWLESPTNPLLAIADLAALIDGAHQLGLTVAVDNTLATPLLQRPLDLGADLVVHSVTKLMSGHSDVVMGAIVCRSPEFVDQVAARRSLHGAVAGPVETYLALRGLRTLPVRLARAQSTAGELAQRLDGRSGVSRVHYPGLAEHPGRELAARQMRGFGTMVAFEVDGGPSAADAVCDAVRLVTPATSLGGVETLIRAGWADSHLPPSLVRLSVGLEDVEDLWSDLDQALAAARLA
jgi:cystathionine gamma-synthase